MRDPSGSRCQETALLRGPPAVPQVGRKSTSSHLPASPEVAWQVVSETTEPGALPGIEQGAASTKAPSRRPPASSRRPDGSTKAPYELPEMLQEFFLPIWGPVRLTAAELRLVDHPAFARLGDIYQLGQTYLVFRGATHKRWEHALGTMHAAQVI